MTNEEIIQNTKKQLGMGEFEPSTHSKNGKKWDSKLRKVSMLQFAQNFGNLKQRSIQIQTEKKKLKTISS